MEEAILSKVIESVKDIFAANSTVETFSKMSEQQKTLRALCNKRTFSSNFQNASVEMHTKFKIVPELFNSKQGIYRDEQNYRCPLEEYQN